MAIAKISLHCILKEMLKYTWFQNIVRISRNILLHLLSHDFFLKKHNILREDHKIYLNDLNKQDLKAATRGRLCEKVFLEISQNLQENSCVRISFFMKLQEACNFILKRTLAQLFPCEFCEISKNTFSYRTALVASSEDL